MSYAPVDPIRGTLARRPGESEHNPKGLAEWTPRSVGGLREISVCTFTADPATNVVAKPEPELEEAALVA